MRFRGVVPRVPWASPQFSRFLAARAISDLGSGIAPIALTFAALAVDPRATTLGIVLGVSVLPALVLLVFGGIAGDRWDRRRILIATDVVMGGCQLVAGLLVWTGQAEIWHLVLTQLVRGSASAFLAPASTAIVPELLPRDHVQEANAALGLSRNASDVVGPAVAGLMIALVSPGAALVLDAVTYFASAALLLGISRSVGRIPAEVKVWTDLREGWQAFSSRPWVWLMVLSFAAYQATVFPVILVLGPVLTGTDPAGVAEWSVVLTVRAVGAIVGGLVLFRWKVRRPLAVSTLILIADAPFLLALGYDAPLAPLAILAMISSFALVAADTLWETTLQVSVPEEVLSRVSSYDWLGSVSLRPVGLALVGLVTDSIGVLTVVVAVVVIHVVLRVLIAGLPPIRTFAPGAVVRAADDAAR